MLEAYEAYVDYDDTMNLVEALVRAIARAVNGTTEVTIDGEQTDLANPFRRMSMFEVIEDATGHDLAPCGNDPTRTRYVKLHRR